MSIEEYDGIMETVRNEIMEAIENLALMTQREFMVLRGEMRSMGDDIRGDMKAMGDDIRNEFHNELQREISSLRNDFRQETHGLREDMEDMRQEMRAGFAAINGMVVNHEIRIERVEKKTGIS